MRVPSEANEKPKASSAQNGAIVPSGCSRRVLILVHYLGNIHLIDYF